MRGICKHSGSPRIATIHCLCRVGTVLIFLKVTYFALLEIGSEDASLSSLSVVSSSQEAISSAILNATSFLAHFPCPLKDQKSPESIAPPLTMGQVAHPLTASLLPPGNLPPSLLSTSEAQNHDASRRQMNKTPAR